MISIRLKNRFPFAATACLFAAALPFVAPSAATAAEKFHVEEATIADIQQAILAKQVTATDVVKLYLARIKAYNGVAVEQPDGILGPIKAIPHAEIGRAHV